ncbi:hypothetical protein CQA81_31355, partial [Klebsiella pneumoniae]
MAIETLAARTGATPLRIRSGAEDHPDAAVYRRYRALLIRHPISYDSVRNTMAIETLAARTGATPLR